MSTPAPPPEGEWTEAVRPTAERLRVAAALDLNFTFRPEGAVALAELLLEMAEKLDRAIASQVDA